MIVDILINIVKAFYILQNQSLWTTSLFAALNATGNQMADHIGNVHAVRCGILLQQAPDARVAVKCGNILNAWIILLAVALP